jgi:AcrR family transcriptional regulator
VANSDELVRKREALLDAAAFEFDLHGYDGTRIQDFLSRAGVTKGGMYHYFTTKREVGEEVLSFGLSRWREVLDDCAADEARGLGGLAHTMSTIAQLLKAEVRVRAAVKIVPELEMSGDNPFDLWQDAVSLRLQQAIVDGEIADTTNLREASMDLVDVAYGICTTPAPWGKSADVRVRLERALRTWFPERRLA